MHSFVLRGHNSIFKGQLEKKEIIQKKLIKMGGVQTPYSDAVKYLGVTLDKKTYLENVH